MSEHLPTSTLQRAAFALNAGIARMQDRIADAAPNSADDVMREHFLAEIRRDRAARDDLSRILREREAAERDAIRHGCYGNG